MKNWVLPFIAISIASVNSSCKSSGSGQPTFCDTTCFKDSLKFTSDAKLKPYVYISASNCMADSLAWSYKGMGVNRKVGLTDFLNNAVHFNKNYVRCYINDTAYAWLLFNDCATGRGYQLKLPFNKTATIGRKSSGINSLDPKFFIADNMVAYTDRGNIFVEDMLTGKTAQMTFGKALEIDYDALHEYIDSVNVTPTRIWVKVKIDNEWKELEKNITLK
ncbi:MAG: hypothetical protein HZB42_12995 [Sphingobacteriales bacterium]|nr:hypothetical protein [Sphingobacteriales bacterium]